MLNHFGKLINNCGMITQPDVKILIRFGLSTKQQSWLKKSAVSSTTYQTQSSGGLKTRDWKTQDWKTREHYLYG